MRTSLVVPRGLVAAFLSLVGAPLAASSQTTPNVVVIVVDDAGVALLGSYNANQEEVKPVANQPWPPPEHLVTPHIDDLAEAGVLFRNVWSTPLCSPTRATLMTGLYGFRTDVGRNPVLSPDHPTLPQRLTSFPERAAIGKWHVAYISPTTPESPGYTPVQAGFSRYWGVWDNVGQSGSTSYTNWTAAREDETSLTTEDVDNGPYLTTRELEEAVAFVDAQPSAASQTSPWFLWLAFHAVHGPYNSNSNPPITTPECDTLPAGNQRIRCNMLFAMDAGIGDLIAAIGTKDPGLTRTTVILLGDNGLPAALGMPGSVNRGSKQEILEGGINVPLIVAGSAVAASARTSPEIEESAALVHTVDVHATVLDLAEIGQPAGTDGVSFEAVLNDPGGASPRTHVYTDGAFQEGQPPLTQDESHPWDHEVAARDAQYKLIRMKCANQQHGWELYDLSANPMEDVDLNLLTQASGSAPAGLAYMNLLGHIESVTGLGHCSAPPPFPPVPTPPGCGLGPELLPSLLLLSALRRRRIDER